MLETVSNYFSNTYLFWNDGLNPEGFHEAMLVDAAASARDVKECLERNHCRLKFIVLTHGHFDHILYLEELREAFPDVPVYCHKAENQLLTDKEANVSQLFGRPNTYRPCDHVLSEGDRIVLEGKEGENSVFTVLSTPGHTPGSVCLYNRAERILFTGDTLFVGTYGRTDFKFGSPADMQESLLRLGTLDGATVFYPGHYESGILGWEY